MSRGQGLLKPRHLLPPAGQLRAQEGPRLRCRRQRGGRQRRAATGHLSKPQEVLGHGGGAALDLHQRDLVLRRQQDVVLVVEDGGQVHAPEGLKQLEVQGFIYSFISLDENMRQTLMETCFTGLRRLHRLQWDYCSFSDKRVWASAL